MRLLLTEDGVQKVIQYGYPVSATDFEGYLITIQKDKNIRAAVSLDGDIKFFHSKGNGATISSTLLKQTVLQLLYYGFLQLSENVFPEFSTIEKLPFDVDSVCFIEQPLFKEVYTYGYGKRNPFEIGW